MAYIVERSRLCLFRLRFGLSRLLLIITQVLDQLIVRVISSELPDRPSKDITFVRIGRNGWRLSFRGGAVVVESRLACFAKKGLRWFPWIF